MEAKPPSPQKQTQIHFVFELKLGVVLNYSYLVPAGAVCEASLAGRQRQVGSAGIRQGAGSGRQGGQRQGDRLTVIVVMRLSVTDGSSFTARPCSLSFSSSSSTACLEQQNTHSTRVKSTNMTTCNMLSDSVIHLSIHLWSTRDTKKKCGTTLLLICRRFSIIMEVIKFNFSHI